MTFLIVPDVMALLKLNRFHWHFADDEAFRLELDYAPELARKTAWRGEGQMMPAVFGGGIQSGGTYSRADVARVLAKSVDELKGTDIADHALAALAESNVKNVYILSRRGPAQAGCHIHPHDRGGQHRHGGDQRDALPHRGDGFGVLVDVGLDHCSPLLVRRITCGTPKGASAHLSGRPGRS